MPCFKGFAVSIHTPDGPLPEYSIQKQSRHSRITSYIPVPPAKVPPDSISNKPEQSTFAISITLLTPGMRVPYFKEKSTSWDVSPRNKFASLLPDYGNERGKYDSGVKPYIPLTASSNETVAAYIYFDGRTKEEVATLLRRGEETWVNSRWVAVPDSEGGGLAEREFLFREVGLEKWLNGLELDSKEAAEKVEARKERMEKRRRRRRDMKNGNRGSGDFSMDGKAGEDTTKQANPLQSYRDRRSPSEGMEDDDDMESSSGSEDDPPLPEAAGQIKVALFRVLASGEIKRGEYSPQFDAHDDDEDSPPGLTGKSSLSNGIKRDPTEIDHTTSFAKPKSLDPKTISTQTVTGIDTPDKPFAVFTFFYRSERQLQKMGILPTPKTEAKSTTTPNKRASLQTDFTKLPPLKPGGTVGFAGFRDPSSTSPPVAHSKGRKSRGLGSEDSEDEDREETTIDRTLDGDDKAKGDDTALLSPEDAARQGELAEGVRKIKLKRAHSAEPLEDATPRKSATPMTPTASQSAAAAAVAAAPGLDSTASPSLAPTNSSSTNRSSPGAATGLAGGGGGGSSSSSAATTTPADPAIIGSPMKRSRPSLAGPEDEAVRRRLGLGLMGGASELFTSMAPEVEVENVEADKALAAAAAARPVKAAAGEDEL